MRVCYNFPQCKVAMYFVADPLRRIQYAAMDAALRVTGCWKGLRMRKMAGCPVFPREDRMCRAAFLLAAQKWVALRFACPTVFCLPPFCLGHRAQTVSTHNSHSA